MFPESPFARDYLQKYIIIWILAKKSGENNEKKPRLNGVRYFKISFSKGMFHTLATAS